uniref:Uncharacterized protein n=1 Tax=Cannabis sativa TaxID=3483 RepID=A0A803Q5R5_CANSA
MHLANFVELCQTFKMNGVSDDAICLSLFPFSLASIRTLETQRGQLATQMANRTQDNLSSTTKANPKETCKVIALRCGKKYERPMAEQQVVEEGQDQQVQVKAQLEKKARGEQVTEHLPEEYKAPLVNIDHPIKIPYT